MNLSMDACMVRGGIFTGGLAGLHFGAMLNCRVNGTVRGQDYVGVLAGANWGLVKDSTGTGAVQGREYVGGLVGVNHDRAVMDQCGADISVRGKEVVGGIAGANLHGRLLASHAMGKVAAAWYVGGLTGINLGFIADCRGISTVEGSVYVGGLSGVSFGKTVFCGASGTVRGDESVGGLFGFAGNGFTLHCHATGDVSGTHYVGGLMGVLDDAGVVRACHAQGDVSGTTLVGGLIGRTSVNSTSLIRTFWGIPEEDNEHVMVMGSAITECYATGDVSGDTCVGGLIGGNLSNIISHCYAGGAVKGRDKTGGLVGLNITPVSLFPAIIRRCYAVGHVSGEHETGGLVGGNDKGRIIKSFWDVHASMQETSDGGGIGIDAGTTNPTTLFQAQDWDFENIWHVENGAPYPQLRAVQESLPTTWDAYLYETPRLGRQATLQLDDAGETNRQAPWAQQLATQMTETSEEQVQQEEIARMEALGYMIAGGDVPDATGVVLHYPEYAWQGLNLYVSEHGPEAILMDMDGRILHRWRRTAEEIWPEDDHAEEGDFWSRAHVFDNGDLLLIRVSRQLVKIDKDSNVLWHADISAHHDFDISDTGDIYVLTSKENTKTETGDNITIVEDYISVLDQNGNEKKRTSLLACFESSPDYGHIWSEQHVKHGDIFHANALRVLDGKTAGLPSEFQSGRVLTSLRELNAIAVIDLDQAKVVWAKRGPWRAQHDPRILNDNALLLFDNYGRPGRSTVYEFELPSMKELWRYQGAENIPFYSETNGRAHRLPNGNTLIIESERGRAFELASSKRIVWEFVNPHPVSENDMAPALLFDVTRLSSDMPLYWVQSR